MVTKPILISWLKSYNKSIKVYVKVKSADERLTCQNTHNLNNCHVKVDYLAYINKKKLGLLPIGLFCPKCSEKYYP